MSIYSANRSGSMVATQEAAASKGNYTHADLGRILYESQVNDMAIFEAVLATDFNEIKSLREGTILESEIAALNEEAKEDLGKKLVDVLNVLWTKIKQMFKNAGRRIAAYIIRSGKAFAEEYEAFLSKKNHPDFPSGIKGMMMDKKVTEIIKLPDEEVVKNAIANGTEANLTVADVSALALARTIDNGATEGVKSSEFYDKVKEIAFKERTIDQADAKACVEFLKNAKNSIKELKNTENDIDKKIADLKKKVISKDEKDSVSKNNAIVSAYQTVLSTAASTSIKIVNKNIKYARLNLASIMIAMKDALKKNKAIGKAYMLEAADEVNEYLDSAPSVDPIGDGEEINAEIDKVLAGAED